MAVTNIILIAIVWVVIIDLSGFVDSVKKAIWKWIFKGQKEYRDFDMKPFSCSFCMTWWTSFFYIVITGEWTLPLTAFSLVIAFMTPLIKDILVLIRDFVTKMIEVIYEYFNL